MAATKTKTTDLNYLTAVQLVKKGEIAPVYLIYGEERYLQDELIDQILEQVLDPATREFNADIFYANDVEVELVISHSLSYPMMAKRRVVVVKDIHNFKAAALKRLADYAAKPAMPTCLILTSGEKTLTAKGYSALKSKSVVVNCRQLYEEETLVWIKNYLKSRRLESDLQAVSLLYQIVGNSLLDLVNEIEKIQVNIAPRTRISVEDVRQITSALKQSTVFELCDAVGGKDFPRSISILNNLIDRGEKPTGIVIQLTKHFINMLKIKESIRLKKTAVSDLVNLTHLNSFFINKVKAQAANYTTEQMRQTFLLLATADYHLKTSYQPPRLVLELLLFKVIKDVKTK